MDDETLRKTNPMSKFALAFGFCAMWGSMGAAQTKIDIPPPGQTPKQDWNSVPEELLTKSDAANLAYVECGYEIERKAHRARLPVNAFARIWSDSCITEESEWMQNFIAILKYQGDPDPHATAERIAQEMRSRKIEEYRKNQVREMELRALKDKCGPNFQLCQE